MPHKEKTQAQKIWEAITGISAVYKAIIGFGTICFSLVVWIISLYNTAHTRYENISGVLISYPKVVAKLDSVEKRLIIVDALNQQCQKFSDTTNAPFVTKERFEKFHTLNNRILKLSHA